MTNSIEATRARYRPERIATLLVGESAPASGEFFYFGNTALAREMARAMTAAGLISSGDFPEQFKARGWYLDDLVLTPVNRLDKAARKKQCRDAQKSLAKRIEKYRPRAIVSLLLSIEDIVEDAAIAAGSDAPRSAVPFPGDGQRAASERKWRASFRCFLWLKFQSTAPSHSRQCVGRTSIERPVVMSIQRPSSL